VLVEQMVEHLDSPNLSTQQMVVPLQTQTPESR
jgi:hypothetical protein